MRSPQLRGRDSAGAVVLAVQEGRTAACIANQGRYAQRREMPRVEFEIFTPTTEKEVRGWHCQPGQGEVRLSATTVSAPRPRAGATRRSACGGADVVFDAKGRRTGGATLLAVVTLRKANRAGITVYQPKPTTKPSGRPAANRSYPYGMGERPDGIYAPSRTSRLPMCRQRRTPRTFAVTRLRNGCNGVTCSRRGRRRHCCGI